jgi:alanine dehydrogenase
MAGHPLKIGILREGKVPPDKRVPFSPEQCRHIMNNFPVHIVVQPSVKRCFSDAEYKSHGIEVSEKIDKCDVLMGIKEVPVQELIKNKTYFFFSHTIKKQPHNRKLLQKMLALNITMIDYETLTDIKGNRLVAFGRYAGIVGAYNAFRAYGEKFGVFKLKPAHQCANRMELEKQLLKCKLPANFKIAVTGTGRVSKGCLEILEALKIKQVLPDDYLKKNYNYPVFTVLSSEHYNKRKDKKKFDKADFYKNPRHYQSDFLKYALQTDMYIPCHFWNSNAPVILEKKDYKINGFKIKIIADISCDVGGPIASTLRASTIADPFYGYDPQNECEADFYSPHTIGVMAVDNLPCELPKDASIDFGEVLIQKILPLLTGKDPDNIIPRATICSQGKLTKYYAYLSDYAGLK